VRRADLIDRLNIPAVEAEPVPRLDATGTPLHAARVFASNATAFFAVPAAKLDRTDKMREHGERLLNSLDAAEAIRAWLRAAK
jgi:hypothetical protein